MSSRWLAAVWLCAGGLAAAACGDDQYDVEVAVVGDASNVTWVQLAVIERCADLASPSDAPSAPIRVVEFASGASDGPLGSLPPGRYGLQGRAWQAGCVLFAAQCKDVLLEAGGEGTLHILLEPGDGRGCDPGRACVDDACVLDPDGT